MSRLEKKLHEALDRIAAGDWQSAHDIAQDHEDNDVANWIHGLCHRMEGDLDNARYWYDRCGQKLTALPPAKEAEQIRAALPPR